MALYLQHVRGVMEKIDSCEVVHVSRIQIRKADALSKLAPMSFQHLAKEIRVEVLLHPTVPLKEVRDIGVAKQSWTTPLVEYLRSA
jgi:hypothetical protein